MQREADIFSFARCGSPCGYGATSIRLDIREAEGSSNDPSFRYSEIKN